MGIHEALEELAVVGHLEVEEFVDDDIVSKGFRLVKKIDAETNPAFA